MQLGPFFFGTIICFVSVVLCLLTGLILLLFAHGNVSRRYLGLFYLALTYGFTTAALYYSGWVYHLPHFLRTGNIAWLIAMPLSWIYIRTVITQKPPSAWDLLGLVAVLVFIVNYFHFLLLPGAIKAEAYRAEVEHLASINSRVDGLFLSVRTTVFMTYLQTVVYWVLQVRLLFSSQAAHIRKEKTLYSWILTFTGLEIGLFLSFPLLFLFGFQSTVWSSAIPPVVGVVLSTLTLMLNPDILYGRSHAASPARSKPVLDTGTARHISAQLETLMKEMKPFLDADYTLKQLADAIGVPAHKLSAYINQVTGSNFSEYLNQWRIRHCLDLYRKGDILHLNQHGIAAMCGFNNRKTFYAAFKKVTGELPSAFLHGQGLTGQA